VALAVHVLSEAQVAQELPARHVTPEGLLVIILVLYQILILQETPPPLQVMAALMAPVAKAARVQLEPQVEPAAELPQELRLTRVERQLQEGS
jgi:hypothetical protein